MMIFLAILKVIGYILLAILGTLISLILLVLFVPIRYSVCGYRDEKTESLVYIEVRISWLLKLLRARYIYPDNPFFRVKILFFTVYDGSKPPKEIKILKEEVKSGASELTDDIIEEVKEEIKDDFTPDEESEKISESTEEIEDESSLPFFRKINQFFKKIVYTIKKFYARMKSTRLRITKFFETLSDYAEKLKSDEVKLALSLCSKLLKRIWKNIRPRKIKANLVVGLDDPAQTAKILQVYSILYPYIGENVFIKPDFDRYVINGDFVIRGRITAYVILWAAWKLYWDKNIRKVIKMFKD